MPLTRRAFTQGGTAPTAASVLPQRGRAETAIAVRRSINDLIRENSPLIESYRRGVDVMMKRDITDKTSWWFQANIHDLSDAEMAKNPALAPYWRQCPHGNYFFLGWHRMYVHFFERIVRKASGDPNFTMPYWAFEDPAQASLPTAFVPDADELSASLPAPKRRNPLARAKRFVYVDRRWIGLGDVSRDCTAALALDRFATDDKLEALRAFGGVRAARPRDNVAAGGLEASPHNVVHQTIGLTGDMGSPETAARDPIFWVHHANIDRMWVKWTDPVRGRIPPVTDPAWMKTKFTFVDEDGRDQQISAADVLDTQFQLGYRYDDDPPRTERMLLLPPPVATLAPPTFAPPNLEPQTPAPQASAPQTPEPQAPASPGAFPGAPLRENASKGAPRLQTPVVQSPVVLARGGAVRLTERETLVALVTVAPAAAVDTTKRMRVVLKDVVARDGVPPYDVFVVPAGPAALAQGAGEARIGGLDLFGGTGHAGHVASGGATFAFEASAAVGQFARLPGFDLRRLSVKIARRSFANATGGVFIPEDPDPPRIGSIELLQS